MSNDTGEVISEEAELTLEQIAPIVSSIHDDIVVSADENCEVLLSDYEGEIVATDNCNDDLTIVQSPVSGTVISGETNQVILTVNDDLGNETTLSFNVAVKDETSPVVSSTHDDKTVDANANCEAVLVDYTSKISATDNCDSDLTIEQTPIAGTAISGTTNQISVTVSDDNNNSAIITFNVSVEDKAKPTISCQESKVIDLEQGQTVYTVSGTEFDPISTSDNCGVASVFNNFNNTTSLNGVELSIETTTIVWTVMDNAENTSNCTLDIEVKAYTALDDLLQYGLSFYPNPTNGKVYFTSKSNIIESVSIYNMMGKKLLTKEDFSQNTIIDISEFDGGFYIMMIQVHDKTITSKIVKE